MRTLQVIYRDEDTEYIVREYSTDIDLQAALLQLAADITDKEDELEARGEQDAEG